MAHWGVFTGSAMAAGMAKASMSMMNNGQIPSGIHTIGGNMGSPMNSGIPTIGGNMGSPMNSGIPTIGGNMGSPMNSGIPGINETKEPWYLKDLYKPITIKPIVVNPPYVSAVNDPLKKVQDYLRDSLARDLNK